MGGVRRLPCEGLVRLLVPLRVPLRWVPSNLFECLSDQPLWLHAGGTMDFQRCCVDSQQTRPSAIWSCSTGLFAPPHARRRCHRKEANPAALSATATWLLQFGEPRQQQSADADPPVATLLVASVRIVVEVAFLHHQCRGAELALVLAFPMGIVSEATQLPACCELGAPPQTDPTWTRCTGQVLWRLNLVVVMCFSSPHVALLRRHR